MTSRQSKKIKIAELSRELPTEEELLKFPELLVQESDRGAAIMASALVENALWVAICCRIADPGEAVTKSWFEGPTAPFASFAAKIKLGRALGIYGEIMEGRLVIIKDVRNAFAHRSRPLDFSHETLCSICMTLSTNPERDKSASARLIFGATSLAIAKMLIQNAFEYGGKEMKVSFP